MKKHVYVTGATADNSVSPLEAKNQLLAREIAEESIVLLQNIHNTLPLRPGRVALYGAGAEHTIKGGTGSGEVNNRHDVSIREGLEAAGFQIATTQWLSDYDKTLSQAKEAYAARMKEGSLRRMLNLVNIMGEPMQIPEGREITEADVRESGCDTAIYVLSRQAGEGMDRKPVEGDYLLTQRERNSLQFMAAHYPHTILVVNSGAQLDLSVLDEVEIGAVIFLCQQGQEGGHALADILTGKVNPSGRLTDTWYSSYADVPFGEHFSGLDGDTEHAIYREGIYIGYRYTDAFGVTPRWPFGFGLSYTTFSMEAELPAIAGKAMTLSVRVTNTGNTAGKEIVQLYAGLPAGTLDKERKRLIAFGKTAILQPGESQAIRLSFPLTDLSSYDEHDHAWIVEKGTYPLMLGNSAAHTVTVAALALDQRVSVRKTQSLCAPQQKVTELHAQPVNIELPDNCPLLPLEAGLLVEDTNQSTPPAVAADEQLLSQLSVREQAMLCVGQGMTGIMQAKKIAALGVIGKTTDKLWHKGIKGFSLSDGPAGLRMLKSAAVRDNGQLKMGEFFMSFMEYMPAFLQKRMLMDPQKDKPLYQYCTAFPVGSAVAQTWNTELARRFGDAVGQEMDKYLVACWLAPAMNIHRNPLCGRNFEYYSEDPLLTGKIAAAVVSGIQSKAGRYATIKHFAANHQEEKRNHSDSIVDERALREIELRGFEICIREAAPAAVMTSYNKINGVYAPNNAKLLQGILRGEWNYRGLVMTDWYATGKDTASPVRAVASGNDLIMPGSGKDVKLLVKAVKEGTLPEAALLSSANRVLAMATGSNTAQRFHPEDFR